MPAYEPHLPQTRSTGDAYEPQIVAVHMEYVYGGYTHTQTQKQAAQIQAKYKLTSIPATYVRLNFRLCFNNTKHTHTLTHWKRIRPTRNGPNVVRAVITGKLAGTTRSVLAGLTHTHIHTKIVLYVMCLSLCMHTVCG